VATRRQLTLESERSRYVPNPQMELRRMDEIWARQKADLEARLKKAFACTSSELLWHNFTPAPETRESLSVPTQNPSLSPLRTSIPFIAKLEFEPLSSFWDFPQTICFNALMRASIYLLDTVRSGVILTRNACYASG
jgi:hypothetical protein